MSQETPEPSAQQPGQGPVLQSPVDVARAAASMTLQEAVNLGEINPAMARRFAERMDQIFMALIRGAGVKWGPDGDLKVIWPEVENPILAAANERKRLRELESSTTIPLDESGQPTIGDA